MTTIKSYTDLSQSEALSKILPLDSADFGWNVFVDGTSRILPINDWDLTKDGSNGVKFFHAWSLAALLGIIQKNTPYKMQHFGDKKIQLTCVLGDKPWELIINDFDNEVDACVAMIEKLHEQKML